MFKLYSSAAALAVIASKATSASDVPSGALPTLRSGQDARAGANNKNRRHQELVTWDLKGKEHAGEDMPSLTSDKESCDLIYADSNRAECESWCAEFFKVCVNPTYFSDSDGFDECIDRCSAYPRTNTVVSRPPATFMHLGSDTFACRDLHLWEAQNDAFGHAAAFHCSHSNFGGGSICSDVEIDGKSPFETLRDGACTHHTAGYCVLSNGGKVADCSSTPEITDATLPNALKMMPDTVEYIFLMENQGITGLPEGLFTNLAAPEKLKALYLDDCMIKDMHEAVFHPLVNLEVLNLNFNEIEVLQDELLKLPKLRQFSIFGDPTPPESEVPVFGPGGGRKPGKLTSDGFSNKVFQYTNNLERLIMYGNPGITELHDGMFEGLNKVHTMFFVFCGLTNAGIPDGVFKPLTSMVYFDFQGCPFTSLPKEWFEDGGWSKNIERLAFFACEITEVDEEVFSWHPKLKQVYLHANPGLDFIPASFYENLKDLEILTI